MRPCCPPHLALALSALPSGGCADRPPLAPLPEFQYAMPAPGMIWVAGEWHFTGTGYVWIPGRWESAAPAPDE